MKLAEHVESIRKLIDNAFRNRLGRMGITANKLQTSDAIPLENNEDRTRIETILETFKSETGADSNAYEKLIEEFTFTLFNRLAALKVMEAHTLNPEIITRRHQHGDRSFAHRYWLEQNPERRNEDMEGLIYFIEDQLTELSSDIQLFSLQHPYHLLPTAIELNDIINAFNQVENDSQVESDIWKSDDVLGWLYESYNNTKKAAHKESKAKTEYNKVSIQSQVYTPRWVVKFLVDNSLGKLYLEMFPDSAIKEKYKIANAPKNQIRDRKPLTEIRIIDPATGSGNFLLYAFDLFYDLYTDQIDNYGADYDENKICELIINHNLHGIDIDDRAIQLAQLGLTIKAKRKKRTVKFNQFNIVSADFFLPEYTKVRYLFKNGGSLDFELEKIIMDLWSDLQQAHKFGSLIRLEEKFKSRLRGLFSQKTPSKEDQLELFPSKTPIKEEQLELFTEEDFPKYKQFRENFFINLQKAVTLNTKKQGLTFLNTKTSDAIIFLKLITQKYDVAVANPPYTDSSDFGTELKKFIDDNYKKPHKFHTNLYASFIKRCYELIDYKGKMALIHPLTFMYIKSFEDVRKFIIDKLHINVFVDYGLSNLFGAVMVDPAFYVLEKEKTIETAWFISLNQYTRTPQEKYKKDYCLEALNDYVENRPNKHNYTLSQSKLKIIEGWPFIYWISDGFREKFKGDTIKNFFNACSGLKTANNIKYFRSLSEINQKHNSKYQPIFKGGPYNKWYGNIWLSIDYNGQKTNIMKENSHSLSGENNYLNKGIVCPTVGTKGTSFRIKPAEIFFSNADFGIFYKNKCDNYNYPLAILNSNLIGYINEMLNPTVNIEVGDLYKIPFIQSSKGLEDNISSLASQNIEIKKYLCSYRIIETNFNETPLTAYSESTLKDRLFAYLNYENAQLTQVLINEAIINQLVFEVYELSPEDRLQVETKMGKPVGELPVLSEAREAYLKSININNQTVKDFIYNLPATKFDEQQLQIIKSEFSTLYQNNNDLEEFCIRHQINPINIWYWFKESKVLPQARAAEIALEFLADAFRTILMEDEDGIIPLVGLPEKPCLMDRLEKYCLDNGFTSAQFMQLDGLIGRPLNEYIENYFFKNFSDHLNLFMYLPKTPFIWHLSSGKYHGFEAYIIIYKWNRDSLYKLKTMYLSKRAETLQYRQINLANSNTAQSQNEKETIRLQLKEIAEYTQKIDELIADEGYNPKLDDGVGKNIAPLQKKGLLKSEVLNKKQLEKYLKADW
ncbi:MAG: BREX-1 system adenine-specific DNA-methyltransferase PglX [Desulfobacterales bacterium]|nr:BREX-1 system adenine-specific DNA-methyltransferase PglX [Desulfobacterales bacterium]